MNLRNLDFYRIPSKGVIAGVCAGLAEQLNVPVAVVRVLWVVAVVTTLGALLVYLAMCMYTRLCTHVHAQMSMHA